MCVYIIVFLISYVKYDSSCLIYDIGYDWTSLWSTLASARTFRDKTLVFW